MNLGGPALDAVEQTAIDYAISQGVIIVSSGWDAEWMDSPNPWWYGIDDPDPNIPALSYITGFSSRTLPGWDLDVAAPGSWIVGPYQVNSGKISYN